MEKLSREQLLAIVPRIQQIFAPHRPDGGAG